MKKNLIVFVVLLVICVAQKNVFAQSESSFGLFLAFPVGKFKSTDLEDGGFAKTGWGIVFDSKSHYKFLPENLSLYFHSSYQWTKIDTEKLSEEYSESLGLTTEISDSKYSPIVTTVGPAYNIPLNDKITFGLTASIGVIFNNTKAFTIQIYDSNDALLAKEVVNFDNAIAFAYTFGAEIKFQLVPDVLAFALFADYCGASQKVDVDFTTADPIDSFQKLQYLNSGFKLVLTKKNN